GAIMAVPAHDERDFEFAQQFKLKITAVVDAGAVGVQALACAKQAGTQQAKAWTPADCFTGDGKAINSGKYDGLSTPEFKQKIAADLAAAGLGREAVNYKLRDWLFSRQRFWGEPLPILHQLGPDGEPNGVVRAVPADLLP